MRFVGWSTLLLNASYTEIKFNNNHLGSDKTGFVPKVIEKEIKRKKRSIFI